MHPEHHPAAAPTRDAAANDALGPLRLTPRKTLALGLVLASVLVAHVRAAQPPLPACDAAETRSAVAGALDDIPAFSGRDARLIELERVVARGAKGVRRLRACQAWLVTDQGAGMLEYSIRETDRHRHRWAVRAELFQGGWRDHVRGRDTAPRHEERRLAMN